MRRHSSLWDVLWGLPLHIKLMVIIVAIGAIVMIAMGIFAITQS